MWSPTCGMGCCCPARSPLEQFKDRELSVSDDHVTAPRGSSTRWGSRTARTVSSFDPADLLTGKMTVYLVLPPEHMRAQSPLLRLWIGSMLRAVVKGGLQEKTKVHFVLDEAASLGHMDALDDAVDKFRGYGVRLQLYYQSLGQLKKLLARRAGADPAVQHDAGLLRRQRPADGGVRQQSARRVNSDCCEWWDRIEHVTVCEGRRATATPRAPATIGSSRQEAPQA